MLKDIGEIVTPNEAEDRVYEYLQLLDKSPATIVIALNREIDKRESDA